MGDVTEHIATWFTKNTTVESFAKISSILNACTAKDLGFKTQNHDTEANKRKRQDLFFARPPVIKAKLSAPDIEHASNTRPDQYFVGLTESTFNEYYKKYSGGRSFTPQDPRQYLQTMITYYIEKYYTRIGAIADSDNKITLKNLEDAMKLLKISIQNSEEILECYGITKRKQGLATRASFALVAGELAASYAKQLQEEEALQKTLRSVTTRNPESVEFACIANLALRFFLKTNGDLYAYIDSQEPDSKKKSDLLGSIDTSANRARKMLTQINLRQCEPAQSRAKVLELAN